MWNRIMQTFIYRWQSKYFLFDLFFILVSSPWYNAALNTLLALNEIFLFFVEFAENILWRLEPYKLQIFIAFFAFRELRILITYVILNRFFNFWACLVNSRVKEWSEILCTLGHFRCYCKTLEKYWFFLFSLHVSKSSKHFFWIYVQAIHGNYFLLLVCCGRKLCWSICYIIIYWRKLSSQKIEIFSNNEYSIQMVSKKHNSEALQSMGKAYIVGYRKIGLY